ncbi:MAG: YfhO family protein [Candidatus Omnitrophota bacterium]
MKNPKKNFLKENLLIIGILSALIAVFFYDIVFLGRTFKVATANAQAFHYGVYGQEHNRPAYIPVNGTDASVLEEPIYQFIKNNFQQGIIPLWNPHQACGYPLIGMIQVGMFFPLHLILYLLPELYSWDILMLARFLFGGLFLYWFMRVLRFPRIPSLGAAIIFMFTGPMTLLQYWIANVEIIAPLLLLSLEKLIREKTARAIGLVAIATALTFFGGHAEHIFFVNGLGFLFFIFRTLTIKPKPNFKTAAGQLSLSYILGFALSAIVLFPFLRNLNSEFWHAHPQNVGLSSGEVIHRIITLAVPHFFQKENLTYDFTFAGWWGGYLGIIPLALVVLSLFNKQRCGLNYFFAAIAFIAVAKSYSFPLINWIGYLPIFDICRFAIHTPHVVALCTAIAAGMGLRTILCAGHLFKKNLVFSATFVAIISGYLLYFRDSGHLAQSLHASIFAFCVLIFFGLILFLKDKNILKKQHAILAIVFLLIFELFLYIHREHPKRFQSFAKIPYIEFLKDTPQPQRAYGVFWQFYPNTATGYGVDDFGIFQDFLPNRFVNFFNQLVIRNHFRQDLRPPALRTVSLPDDNPLLDMLNLKYIVAPINRGGSPEILLSGSYTKPMYLKATLADTTKAAYSKEVVIYERTKAFPRAFIVHRAIFDNTSDVPFNAIKFISQNLNEAVVLEGASDREMEKQLSQIPVRDNSKAEITRYTANEVIIEADLENAGLVVLSDAFHPDWKVFVDNKPSKLYATNYLIRSVFAPAGKHTVRFSFEPPSFYIGCIVSILSFLLVILLIFRAKKE